jgi:hypothetical protein
VAVLKQSARPPSYDAPLLAGERSVKDADELHELNQLNRLYRMAIRRLRLRHLMFEPRRR